LPFTKNGNSINSDVGDILFCKYDPQITIFGKRELPATLRENDDCKTLYHLEG
jgi:hypothetical protein